MSRFRVPAIFAMSAALAAQGIAWRPWSPASFAEARAARKLVLVDAEASWCHWCHVMEERTYADPEVQALLAQGFVAVKADIDRHPDAQELYADIGWPGTVLYGPDGAVLHRERGYIPPETFKALLRQALAGKLAMESEAAPTVPAASEGLPALRDAARKELDARFDARYGGWGEQKYPIAMNLEELFHRAHEGDAGARWRALYTLKQQRDITDPVWGGIFQYSAGPDWHQTHFEKLTTLQAGYLENLAEAFRATGDRDFLAEARPVLAYLRRFLRHDDGGFSATMDADVGGYDHSVPFVDGHDYYRLGDAGRLKRGLPRIDTRRYAKEQGLLIAAFSELDAVMADPQLLADARAAQRYAEGALATPEGAYAHEAGERDALFLADQVAMLKGLLSLYEATGEAAHLDRAIRLEAAIRTRLQVPEGLFLSRTRPEGAAGAFAEARTPFDENIALARCELRLEAFTGDAAYRDRAAAILKALGTRARLDDQGRWLGDFVLAATELEQGLGHAAVVGPRADPRTRALFRAARAAWAPGLVVLLHDPADGAPRNPDLGFPPLKDPAVFVCGGGRCSRPFADPGMLGEELAKTR
ncbi:MAG TPA: DUF255 domain-containing protein [Holophagaceae bacterium]|nr:DUF255 domain-containing protein [Holophagaceae bacterium]